jgi:hypothetical protein
MDAFINCHIYALSGPDGTVRYVGATVLPPAVRCRAHVLEAQRVSEGRQAAPKSYKHKWVAQLLAQGQCLSIVLLEICDVLLAGEREIYWHEHFAAIAEQYTSNPRQNPRTRYGKGRSIIKDVGKRERNLGKCPYSQPAPSF